MRNFKRFFAAVVLAFALATSALGGEISTTVTAPTPAPTPASVSANGEISTTIAGQMETDGSRVSADASMTEVALSLLQSMLALF